MAKKKKKQAEQTEATVEAIEVAAQNEETPAEEGTLARGAIGEDLSPEAETVVDAVAADSPYLTDEQIIEAATAPASTDELLAETPAAAPETNLITDIGEIESVLEAIIFAAPKAVTTLKLKNLLRSFGYDVSGMAEVLESMIQRQEGRGFQLVKVGGGYQYRTHSKHSDVMQKMLEDRPAKLSGSALEVLSIIAYKQPITRAEIDSVRGVDSGHLMKGLLEKNLIRTLGHAESPGRPMLYGSAPYFLEVFGLNSLDDLPALDQMNRELVGDPNGMNGDETLTLTADGQIIGADSSGLAANPDRGDFDAPAEDHFEDPDFGSPETAASANN